MLSHYFLGFGAGGISLLAPCVLPIIPLVFNSSKATSFWGPFFMAFGLATSFTILGILTSLFSNLFDIDIIQKIGAVILILAGLIFIFPQLKTLLTERFSFIGNFGGRLQGRIKNDSWYSEFSMGVVLAMIWGPCSGPTLAFAFGIASQSEQIIHASAIFFFFGLGAGLNLILLGFALKKFNPLKNIIRKNNNRINFMTGIFSMLLGLVILTNNLDTIESKILMILPQWLINFSSSI